jgi:hypothetical protein
LFGISETVMFVTHRKRQDAPFIPPLDVPAGTAPPSATFAQRYWPAFHPATDPERAAERAAFIARIRELETYLHFSRTPFGRLWLALTRRVMKYSGSATAKDGDPGAG